jgi:peptidoglycan-associated lipoprotein
MAQEGEHMQKRIWMILLVGCLLPVLVFSISCSKKAVEQKQETYAATGQDTDSHDTEASTVKSEVLETDSEDKVMMITIEDIYFQFDRSTLTPQAKESLVAKAEWLKIHPDVKVLIEGHCDERGTNEYNLALGDRRAESVRTFLLNLGISSLRLDTISYGEERPIAHGHNESAWAKNRRAHFAVKEN